MDTHIQGLLEHIRLQRLFVDYACIAAAALYFYDYFLTIQLEINLIWFSSWTYTKVIYLGARYLPMISIFFLIHNQLFPDAQGCALSYNIATWLSAIGLVFAEIILGVRTWAVLRRDRKVGCFLAIILTGNAGSLCYFLIRYVTSLKIAPQPYESYRGCTLAEFDNVLYIVFYSLAILDVIVLSLMTYSAIKSYRFGDNLRLSNIIHRDGILFYVYLLGITAAGATIARFASKSLLILLLPLQDTIYSVLTTRVILNIRDAMRRGPKDTLTELHSTYQDTLPLDFEPMEAESGSAYTMSGSDDAGGNQV